MLVEELIEVLKAMPQDAHVWADGGDDSYPVVGAEVDWQGDVTIRILD